jgi:hypothetical protein
VQHTLEIPRGAELCRKPQGEPKRELVRVARKKGYVRVIVNHIQAHRLRKVLAGRYRSTIMEHTEEELTRRSKVRET